MVPNENNSRLNRSASRTEWSTRSLLRRGRGGDRLALDRLFSRLVHYIRRWAHGRLPKRARALTDTVDLAQDAAVGVWRQLDHLDIRRPGDLEAYVRQAVRNRIRDQARRLQRQPDPTSLHSDIPDSVPTVLEHVMDAQMWDEYRKALAQLDLADREAIIARFEFGYSYDDVAALLEKPSAAAARMSVNRAMDRLKSLIPTTH